MLIVNSVRLPVNEVTLAQANRSASARGFNRLLLHANASSRTIIRDNADSDKLFTVWDAAV
jgi:hypothetical protein